MREIINAPEAYTGDVLRGIYAAHPDTLKCVEDDLRCYYTAKKRQGKVVIITGGGIEYLPLFLGYAGENLLDGCGVGGVFRSPSSEQFYSVVKEVEARARVLFLYGSYTGDIMSSDTATGMLDIDDIKAASIVGADGVLSNKDVQVRQGVARIFFMYKCTGAMATRMRTLEEVLDAAKKTKENTRTVGFALTPCVIPEIGHSNFTLAEDEMTFSMGIHGEPGVWNGLAKTANGLAGESVREILGGVPLNPGEEVCLPINGLGAASQEELYILSGNVHRILEEKGIKAYRTFVGECTTSTEMVGASISICRMADQEMRQWINMPVHTPFYTQV